MTLHQNDDQLISALCLIHKYYILYDCIFFSMSLSCCRERVRDEDENIDIIQTLTVLKQFRVKKVNKIFGLNFKSKWNKQYLWQLECFYQCLKVFFLGFFLVTFLVSRLNFPWSNVHILKITDLVRLID